MKIGEICLALTVLLAAPAGTSSQSRSVKANELVVAKVAQPLTLDGRGEEAAWRSSTPLTLTAKGVMPRSQGSSTHITLRAAYTDTHLYLLATWDDATKDDQGHRTWKWDAEKKVYVEDSDREDMFAVAFEHTGEFVPDMLAGVEATWDIWHWKAFRTNPQGHAMDKTHRYTKTQPAGRANKHPARDGTETWIARPEDAGDTVEKQQPAPTEFKGDRVARYSAGTPTGSAADVQAKGAWSEGKWALEISRRLNTGQTDDTAFDPTRTYRMAVSAHDRTGEMDKASGLIVLSFRK